MGSCLDLSLDDPLCRWGGVKTSRGSPAEMTNQKATAFEANMLQSSPTALMRCRRLFVLLVSVAGFAVVARWLQVLRPITVPSLVELSIANTRFK